MRPLTELINVAPQRLGNFWKPKHQRAFKQLQEITRNLPNLKIIDPEGILHIYHDTSSEAFGGVMAQEMLCEDGKVREYPLHFFSRLHQGSEKHYSVPEAEMQSLALLIHKYRHHLVGRPFIVHSDSAVVYWALRNLSLQKPTFSRTVKRLALRLEGLSFQVKHISSELNPSDWQTRLQYKQDDEVKVCDSNRQMNLPNVIAGVIMPRDNEISVVEAEDFSLSDITPDWEDNYEDDITDSQVYLGNVGTSDTIPPTTVQDTNAGETTLQDLVMCGSTTSDVNDESEPWDRFTLTHNGDSYGVLLPRDIQHRAASDNVIKLVEDTQQFLNCSNTSRSAPKMISAETTLSKDTTSDTAVMSAVTRLQSDTELVTDVTSQLVEEQSRDPFLQRIRKEIRKSPDGTHSRYGEQYYVRAGIIYSKNLQSDKRRIVAPKQIIRDIIISAHSPGHLGVKKTVERIKNKWSIPHLTARVRKFIRHCHVCQMYATTTKGGELHELPPNSICKAKKAGEVIAIDVFSAGANINSPYKYVIAAIDTFSRHVWCRNLKSATSEAIAAFLVEDVFRYQVPRKILSDNAWNISGGTLLKLYESINKGFSSLQKHTEKDAGQREDPDINTATLLEDTEEKEEEDSAPPRITQITSSPYHPMSNGVIERFFRSFREWMSKAITSYPENWHKMTGILTYLYNTSICRALKTSPCHVHYGIPPSAAYADVLDLLQEGGQFSEDSYIQHLSKEIKDARKLAEDIRHQDQYYTELGKQFYRDHKRIRPHDFEVGSLVLVKRNTPRQKFDSRSPFMGPARVQGLIGKHVLWIEYLSNGFKRKVSATQCKHYHEDSEDKLAKESYNGPEQRNPFYDFIHGDDDLVAVPAPVPLSPARDTAQSQAPVDSGPAMHADTSATAEHNVESHTKDSFSGLQKDQDFHDHKDDQLTTEDMRSPGDNTDEHPRAGDHHADYTDEHYRVTHPSEIDGVDGKEITHPMQDMLSELSEQTEFAPEDRFSVDQEQDNVIDGNDTIDDDYRPEQQSGRVNLEDISDIDVYNEDDDVDEQTSTKKVGFKGQKNIRDYDKHLPAEDVSQLANRKVPVSPLPLTPTPSSAGQSASTSTGARRNPRRSARTLY